MALMEINFYIRVHGKYKMHGGSRRLIILG